MGAKIRHLGGAQDGEFTVCTDTDAYVAGQPLKINTSGNLELCKCYREGNDDGYCGLAKGWSGSTHQSDKLSDLYNTKGTYWMGYNQLKLDRDDPRNPYDSASGTGDDYPYDIYDTFTPGDDLYINASGKLTNSAGPYDTICDGATPVAYVMATPSGGAETGPIWLIINQVR